MVWPPTAMEAEAAPLVERLQLQRTPGLLGAAPLTCECFTGSAHGMNVSVVTSGKCWRYGVDSVGTVPAALAAYAVLTTLKPDLLLNAGTAGGFRSRGGGAASAAFPGAGAASADRDPQPPPHHFAGFPPPLPSTSLGNDSSSVLFHLALHCS